MAAYTNADIAKALRGLASQRRSIGEEYSAKAYEAAARTVEKYPEHIVSGQQLSHIRGIGAKIALQIDNIIHGNIEPEVQAMGGKNEVIKEFMKIHGVGEVTATKWYNRGFRRFSDIPVSELTSAQYIGLMYLNEFELCIPREEIKNVEDLLDLWIKIVNDQYPGLIRLTLAGSYRRLKPTCGDIDIVITTPSSNINEIVDYILQCPRDIGSIIPSPPYRREGALPLFTDILARGERKVLAVCDIAGIHRRIDFQLTSPHEYEYSILYFTGSKDYNIYMRNVANEKGWTLSEYGMKTIEGGYHIPASNEREIFDLLQISYKEPWEREIIKK